MAPLNDAQLAEQLIKVQDLLDQLEKLVRHQNANPDGNFEVLVGQGIFQLSKKERQALNAGDKAKSAVQNSETAQKSQLDAKSKLEKTVKDRANDKVVNTARGEYWEAVEEADAARNDATEEVKRAVNKLDNVLNLRLKSHTRQEQARQAQDAADRQASEAQQAIGREAPHAQEAESSFVGAVDG